MDMEFEDDVSLSPPSPAVKTEQEDVKPDVKPEKKEPEEEDYEDSLDLDTSQQSQRVMLVRLPEYLMTKLNENSGQLSGADLGKVFIPQGPDMDPKKMRLVLNNDIDVLRPLPHRYDLNITNSKVENEFIMKEQEFSVRKSGAETGGVRKMKRTALVGHAMNECTLIADMSDPNYRYVLAQRKLMELPQADRQTTMLDSLAGVGGAKYGATLRQQKESWRRQVIKRQIMRNSSDGKAIRIPRNELLDMLFRAFEETPYWTVRGLRERTKQPEVYLRAVLDSIAILNKRGPYAMKYGLKEEYKALQSSGASVQSMVEQAPAAPEGMESEFDNDNMDEDEEDMEMENVEIA